jgi:hypothetical protein
MEDSVEKAAGSDAITLVRGQVDQYMNDTRVGRAQSERCRDYYDHKQWTPAEIEKLKKRNQAPIVVNRIKPKVEGLLGLYNTRRTDPKSFPRTPKHEKAAQAITDALRFVSDQNDFDKRKLDCAGDFWVEGTCGAIIDVRQGNNGKIKIRVARIPWDRIYYDPHSRELDFEDARYKGMMIWLGEDQIREMFPDKADLVDQLGAEHTDETFEDRPRWQDRQRKRYRLAYHFWIKEGAWWYCIFSGDTFFVEPEVSPFLDDEGQPTCPIELASANIDRDNMRYGEVLGYLPLQDEINHRRSKALHLLSQRQTKSSKGAVKDVSVIKRELAKPDGHIELNGPADSFEILPTGDMAQGQFELLIEAKAELDAIGMNAQLSGERQQGDLSGKAIDRLQQAGTLELNRQFNILTNWELRVYRQIWARIKQFWDGPEWVRVTDDQDNLRWVGLNSEITVKQFLEEQINDESLPLSERRRYAASYQFLMSAAQNPDPNVAQVATAKLDEIMEIRNNVAELDVDVILEQSYDVVNIEQEQFDLLAKLIAVPGAGIDPLELIRVSAIRGRDEMVKRIEESRTAQQQANGNIQMIAARKAEADVAKTMSEVQLNTEDAMQKRIENTLLVTQPAPVTSVAV